MLLNQSIGYIITYDMLWYDYPWHNYDIKILYHGIPNQKYLHAVINNIEMVQGRATRWVKQEYGIATIWLTLKDLKWTTLSKCWQYNRLVLFNFTPTSTYLSSEYLNIICPSQCLIAHNGLTIYIYSTILIYNILPNKILPLYNHCFTQ